MDLVVAVAASAAARVNSIWETEAASSSRAVNGRMAFIAQARARDFQQKLIVRSVRLVAVQAILAHRRVLPQHRSALFRMALVASVVD